MAIASSSPKNQIDIVISKFGIKKYFHAVISRDDVKKLKPHPDIYLKAVKNLKENSSECIALEDSESGVLAAKNAGVYVIAVPNKYTKHQDFSQADMIIDSLSELNELLKNFL